ncbi:MAG: peptidoglycan DD-metalloendopeptidase family protein [Patescibacteria group bacterium]
MFKSFLNIGVIIILIVNLILPVGIRAANIDELKFKISEKNQEMQQLEAEIEKWEGELKVVGEQKKTLSSEVNYLSTTEKKLTTDLSLTAKQIESTNLKIQQLSLEIGDKNNNIEKNELALAEAMRGINEKESYTMLEIVLANKTMSDFWNDLESLQNLQNEINLKTKTLKELKTGLEINKTESEINKENLSAYKNKLSDQKQIVAETKTEKNQLLTVTKNQESTYQKILEEKLALKKAFEDELAQFEEALRIAIDPNSIPNANNSILSWPLNPVRITQYFGNTPFATANPQVYNGGGHNGVDFGASTGTSIKTALSGTIEAVGDTDTACPGASYGKWVLVRHPNGLSSLYAHLSLIKVSEGQSVVTGDVIGYSGNTGYSTGPHLHFTVYATQGVRVQSYNFKSCKGKTTTMPIATKEAYLNPLSYLPEL